METDRIMDLRACPQCGSEWFVSTRSGERIVFQMDVAGNPLIVQPDSHSPETVPIDPDHLFCGACTWKGPATALVISRM